MESDQRNDSKLLRGLFVGSVLGAAAGFLLAPKSGKELRSGIKEKTNKALERQNGYTQIVGQGLKMLVLYCREKRRSFIEQD